MDSPVSTPARPSSSGDGIYGLADDSPAPAPEPKPAPRPEPPAPDATTVIAASAPTPPAAPPPAAEAAKPEAKDEGEAPKPEAPPKPKVRRVRRVRRWDAPAWVVSAAVHIGILVTLGLITFAPEIQSKILNLNSSLVPLKKGGEEELTTIYADPSNAPRDQAVGDTSATTPGGGGGLGSGVGTGPPSATPVVGGRGSGTARVGEGTSLPSVKVVGPVSGLAMLPAAPGATSAAAA